MRLPKKGRNREGELIEFSSELEIIRDIIGFKISPRGWGYELEGMKLVTKDQIDLVENLVNECRDKGYLAIDFVAEEEGRQFSGVENPETTSPIEYMGKFLAGALECEEFFTPDWWGGEEYYIQMVVEKIDLKTLFGGVCGEYHIPIATAKGWSSKLMRATYARRFKVAEGNGLKCVLLYCGDHDPDGLRISEFLMSNLEDLKNVVWEDGTEGYNPKNLIIDRFGLDYGFITENNLIWIDNLITGSGGYLAKVVNGKIVQGKTSNGKPHPNFCLPYVQEYLKKYGARKVEANAILKISDRSRELCRGSIEEYLGKDALSRFEGKRQKVRDILVGFRAKTGLTETITTAIETIKKEK